MKLKNKILFGLGILLLIIIIANVYFHFKYPFSIKYFPIPQIKF